MNDLHSVVIHDVKNQLAELAMRLAGRGDAEKEVDLALNCARRLTEMLLLFQDEQSPMQVNVDSVFPRDFMVFVLEEFREFYPWLIFELNDALVPDTVFFDEALVRLAINNALHNACHYAQTKVCLSACTQDALFVLEVSDDGPGYPDKVLQSEGKLPSAVSLSGTGLGLFLARKIAALHTLQGVQGSIELSNAPGARFRMLLP